MGGGAPRFRASANTRMGAAACRAFRACGTGNPSRGAASADVRIPRKLPAIWAPSICVVRTPMRDTRFVPSPLDDAATDAPASILDYGTAPRCAASVAARGAAFLIGGAGAAHWSGAVEREWGRRGCSIWNIRTGRRVLG